MTKIHPSAIVEKGAELDSDGNTVLGKCNQIFPYAFIGGKTHDLKFKGGNPGLRIGDNNVFREYTTAHCSTADKNFTIIGNNNNILAYSHIAHDCIVGDYIVMSSHSALGGHVIVENHAVIGWGSGAHQFCRIGAYAMLSASSKLVKDLPPFFMADGSPAEVCAINKINMQRNGFSPEEIELVYSAFKLIYRRRLTRPHAIEELSMRDSSSNRVIKAIIEFANGSSERGLA